MERVVVDDNTLHRDSTRQILDAYPTCRVIDEPSSGELARELSTQFFTLTWC